MENYTNSEQDDSLLHDLGKNIGYIKKIITNKVEIAKIDFAIAGSNILGSIAVVMVVAAFAMMFVFFMSLGLAVALGKYLGSLALGYLLVALIYGVLLGIIAIFRNAIIFRPISNAMAEEFFKTTENEDQ